MRKDGERRALDDDGNLLSRERRAAPLEVAHIIPHSLMTVAANSELSPSKQAALAILNMFDTGVVHEIEGSNIDRPRNALTLTQENHDAFGRFEIFFEHVADYTYRIDTLEPRYLFEDLPVTRTLHLSENRTIDPPSPRLLAVHRAIAHILHLSAAGEYIDKLLRDIEGQGVCAADGSTEIGRLLQFGLRGALAGVEVDVTAKRFSGDPRTARHWTPCCESSDSGNNVRDSAFSMMAMPFGFAVQRQVSDKEIRRSIRIGKRYQTLLEGSSLLAIAYCDNVDKIIRNFSITPKRLEDLARTATETDLAEISKASPNF
ncbi:hypothetical protein NPX13_g9485 [Xylaria arbuscula]|uniref:HNH nuclease domain-containing protein n=1 Tax=Xylaria arbuscula TaxID=114810 RepID=A0A9W8THF8_9PEZI|nr:hypothetical protein NPX13_g9485 [Xylaria arbuscula]